MTTTTTFKGYAAKPNAIRALRKLTGDEPSNFLCEEGGQWGFHVGEDKAPVTLTAVRQVESSDEPEATGDFNPGAFASLVNSQLGAHAAEEQEQAEEAAIAALRKAKAPARTPSAVKPALTTGYRVGAYKGRAGAMYAFMARVGTLGDVFSRQDVIASCEARPIHDAIGNRAQVLDYFAWAARHGLLVEATAVEVAAWESAKAEFEATRKAEEAKAERKARRDAKKAATTTEQE